MSKDLALKVNEIFRRFEESKPNPKIELDYTSPYTLLVSVVLSAQSTDVMVNRVTKPLYEVASTPKDIYALGVEGLKSYIKQIGLFNSKAKNIIALSKILVEQYDSEVPLNFDDLCSLPGVGRKSANVVLNTLCDAPVIAVDTHVFRVANRIGLCHEKTVFGTENASMKVIPAKWLPRSNQWLVLHGRYVCKARKPECAKCLISDLCEYYSAN